MFEKASKRLGMEHAVFAKGAFHQSDEAIEAKKKDKPSTEEIENLLKFGAYAFLDDQEDKEEMKKSIDEILKDNTVKKDDKKGGYSFSFEVDEKLEDKEFWQKMLPNLETVSIQAMEKMMRAGKFEIIKDEANMREYLKNLKVLVG